MLLLGIKRVQINATIANDVIVHEDQIPNYRENLLQCAKKFLQIEFILQYNDETKKIWEPLLADLSLQNVVVLFDASCGTGIRITELPKPSIFPKISSCGYAGGIGPNCIDEILALVSLITSDGKAADGFRGVWIDMESSLRAVVVEGKPREEHGGGQLEEGRKSREKDVFSVEKCMVCIDAALRFGMPSALD